MTVETQAVTTSVPVGTWGWTSSDGTPKPNESKQVRTNTGEWTLPNTLYIHEIDNSNTNQQAILSRIKTGDVLTLQNSANSAVFTVSNTAVDSGAYYTISVIPKVQSGTLPADGTAINISVVTYVDPTPEDGHMYMDLLLQPNITPEIVADLQEYLCDYLVTVTHLVNHVTLSANVGGVIINDSEPILPVSIGDLVPPAP